MARIRSIKPEFFTSLTIAGLTPEQRLTFIGLWTFVDDEGRGVDDPRLVKAAVWPLDDRTAADIEADLAALAAAGLVLRYSLTEDSVSPHGALKRRSFIAVTGWSEHQRINRPTKSRFPRPDQGESTPPDRPTSKNSDSLSPHGALTEDSLPEQGTGNREQGDTPSLRSGAAPRKRATRTTTRGTRIPDDFTASPDMIAWAREHTPNVGQAETDKFIDYWRAAPGNKGIKTDWTATWRNWMRRAAEDVPRSHVPARGGSTGSKRVDKAIKFLHQAAEFERQEQATLALPSFQPQIIEGGRSA